MVIPTEDAEYIVPFEYHGGATILVHQTPTDEEINTLPVVDVTDFSQTWTPKTLPEYKDDEVEKAK